MRIGLTIAGSDSGGGAGIQADIKAMQANGVYAASVITAVTAQNTRAVTAVWEVPLDIITAQIEAVLSDLDVAAVKTGMLSSAPIVRCVAGHLAGFDGPVVIDPVMISTTGHTLLAPDAIDAVKTALLPLATVLTPNAHEAAALVGFPIDDLPAARAAAEQIAAMGPAAVLLKGGHIDEQGAQITDLLYADGVFTSFTAPRIDTPHTHGTGCTTAAALAANLARGFPLSRSVARTRRYLSEALAAGLVIGGGRGPVHHFYFLADSGLFPPDAI